MPRTFTTYKLEIIISKRKQKNRKKEKESNPAGSGWTKAGKNAMNKPEGRMADFYCRVLKNRCRTCFSFFMYGFEIVIR